MNDTVEEQPVDESLEDEISSLIDGMEIDDEDNESKPESEDTDAGMDDGQADAKQPETDEEGAAENSSESDEDAEAEDGDASVAVDGDNTDDDGEEAEDDLADSEGEEPDKLEAPEHWSASDKEEFNEQPKSAQEYILRRHKEMEGDYTRKRQLESTKVRLAESVADALAPYENEFSRAGLDHAGAVRQLAGWHNALKESGRDAIFALANTYGIDLTEPDIDDATDPAIRSIQKQIGELQGTLTRQEQEAQQSQQEALIQEIQNFEEAKDDSGKLLHPHFAKLKDDITALFTAGLAKSLDEGYDKALKLRPDLQPTPKEPAKVVSKADSAEKVKKAKKAATGIRSSGAVGKQTKELSLQEEIASLMG